MSFSAHNSYNTSEDPPTRINPILQNISNFNSKYNKNKEYFILKNI